MNPKCILMVDDEAGVTRSLKLSLEATGGHAVAAGSTVYLAKPVDTEELIKGIEQTFSQTMQPQHHASLLRP